MLRLSICLPPHRGVAIWLLDAPVFAIIIVHFQQVPRYALRSVQHDVPWNYICPRACLAISESLSPSAAFTLHTQPPLACIV